MTRPASSSGQVTDVVGEQAKAVLSETGHQARQLLEQGVGELRGQAREGQQKVAGGLRGLADQLHDMAERSEGGVASDVVRQVSQRARGAATWLESRELIGRLTRSMVTAAKNDEPDSAMAGHGMGPGGS